MKETLSEPSGIRRLPSHVVDLIKAGEVIERPGSIVKELFENAVDAGATEVTVELLDGGRALVRIVDNGCGIRPEEISLALERHATSKLTLPEDLLEMTTFGFRGEALASIAAVGRLTLRSRVANEALAREVDAESGVLSELRSVAAPVGTSITLKDLFSSLPARRKFLKSTATEFSHVQDYLLAMALAYPRVGLRLVHNGREVFRLPAAPDLSTRFAALHKDEAAAFVPFRYERGSFRVEGLAGLPETARPLPRLFLTFVNGRLVKDKVVRGGVLAAYGGLVLKGLLPSAVVFVTMDPARVDVNAHPAKTEVRFEDPLVVEDLVTVGIQEALKKRISSSMLGARSTFETHVTPTRSGATSVSPGAAPRFAKTDEPHSAPRTASARVPFSASAFAPSLERDGGAPAPRLETDRSPAVFASRLLETEARAQPKEFTAVRGAFGTDCHYLGQYANCYLMFQSDGDLLIVDQHAFHERVLYEDLSRAATEAGTLPRQEMLSPLLVPVPRSVVGLVAEAAPAFLKLGFSVEALDSTQIAVHAYPAFLPVSRAAQVFEEVLARVVALSDLPGAEVHPLLLRASSVRGEFASLGAHERSLEAASVFHLLHSTMACHAAVRAGDPLNEELVRRLLLRSQDVDFFAHCPHGRPVYRRLKEKEVAEWFLRI
jgi:DNA mismatch repair protein MutL